MVDPNADSPLKMPVIWGFYSGLSIESIIFSMNALWSGGRLSEALLNSFTRAEVNFIPSCPIDCLRFRPGLDTSSSTLTNLGEDFLEYSNATSFINRSKIISSAKIEWSLSNHMVTEIDPSVYLTLSSSVVREWFGNFCNILHRIRIEYSVNQYFLILIEENWAVKNYDKMRSKKMQVCANL